MTVSFNRKPFALNAMTVSFNRKPVALNDPDILFNSIQVAFKRNDLTFRHISRLHVNAWLAYTYMIHLGIFNQYPFLLAS